MGARRFLAAVLHSAVVVLVAGGLGVSAPLTVSAGADTFPPPVVTPVPDRAPNAAGWYSSPVTVHWMVTDPYATATQPADSVTGYEGPGILLTSDPSCDPYGDCATGSFVAYIDSTAPSIAGFIATARNSDGSYTAPLTVHWTCADSLSGIASCSPETTITTPGTGLSVTGYATDFAGNQASKTFAGLTVVASSSPPSGAAPDPRIGVLTSSDGPQCTATVLRGSSGGFQGTPNGDVIVTAAHCVDGFHDFAFAPGARTPAARQTGDYSSQKVSAGITPASNCVGGQPSNYSPNVGAGLGATPYGVWETHFVPIYFTPNGCGGLGAADYAFLVMDRAVIPPPNYVQGETLEQAVGGGYPAQFAGGVDYNHQALSGADTFGGKTASTLGYDVNFASCSDLYNSTCYSSYPSDNLGPHSCSGTTSINGGWLEISPCNMANYSSGSPFIENGNVVAVHHGPDPGTNPCCGYWGPLLDSQAQTLFTVAEEQSTKLVGNPGQDVGMSADPNGTASAGPATFGNNTIQASAVGVGSVEVTEYPSNPGVPAPPGGAGGFFDVAVSPTHTFSTLNVQTCGPPPPNPHPAPGQIVDSTPFFWWNPAGNAGRGAWVRVTPIYEFRDPSDNCITLTLSASSAPTIQDLTGTVFAIGFHITTVVLPPAHRGTQYSFQLTADGGVLPYTWKARGALPKGLRITSTGLVRGSPSPRANPGVYNITVQATDHRKPKQGGRQSESLQLSLTLS